jgi:hypothetical protein
MVWRVPAAVIEHGHRGVHMHWRVDKGLDEEDRGPADPERCAADMIQAALAAEDSVASLAGGTPDTGRGVQQVAGHAVDMLGPADNARSTRGCRCSHSMADCGQYSIPGAIPQATPHEEDLAARSSLVRSQAHFKLEC